MRVINEYLTNQLVKKHLTEDVDYVKVRRGYKLTISGKKQIKKLQNELIKKQELINKIIFDIGYNIKNPRTILSVLIKLGVVRRLIRTKHSPIEISFLLSIHRTSYYHYIEKLETVYKNERLGRVIIDEIEKIMKEQKI